MNTHILLHQPIKEMIKENPVLKDFFSFFQIQADKEGLSFFRYIESKSESYWEQIGISRHEFTGMFVDYIAGMNSSEITSSIHSLEILAGKDKDNQPEKCSLLLKPGEITCLVGPTGSGKSRLLADIEWLANGDTPTKRKVLINGKVPNDTISNQFGGKLIAQITQNMNFVLDMDVESFLMLHAQSRFLPDAKNIVTRVIDLANELSGESFTPKTPITFLSGGQSRALMIADAACIGMAPVVLIDEIENAGVNKKKALDLLVHNDKIVLIATHDPLLILLAHKRIIIKNGGMQKVIITSDTEKNIYNELNKLDEILQMTKNYLRFGNELSDIEGLNLKL